MKKKPKTLNSNNIDGVLASNYFVLSAEKYFETQFERIADNAKTYKEAPLKSEPVDKKNLQ